MDEAVDHARQPGGSSGLANPAPPDSSRVAALYSEHAGELRRFVLGVVRDPHLAADVLQATFAKAVEQGHAARDETLKGWIFRVAFHEAMAAKRTERVRDRGARRLAGFAVRAVEAPDQDLLRGEAALAVREALRRLPEDQRRVVEARIYEDKTFAQIARDAGLPLGTVLTRMRLALEKLRRSMAGGG